MGRHVVGTYCNRRQRSVSSGTSEIGLGWVGLARSREGQLKIVKHIDISIHRRFFAVLFLMAILTSIHNVDVSSQDYRYSGMSIPARSDARHRDTATLTLVFGLVLGLHVQGG